MKIELDVCERAARCCLPAKTRAGGGRGGDVVYLATVD